LDVVSLIAGLRDDYQAQFAGFVDVQVRAHPEGAPEVKLRLSEGSGLLHDLFCVDFLVTSDGAPEAIELHPEPRPAFEPFDGGVAGVRVRFEDLRWDDATFRYAGGAPDPESLALWFLTWFDPHELRGEAANDEDADLSGVIHSVSLTDGAMHVDFGTAPPEAFWELLQVLADGGVSAVTVTAGKDGAE
jgi:hypothetical protein